MGADGGYLMICDLFGNEITSPEMRHAIVDRLTVWDFYYVLAEKLGWFQSSLPVPALR
jgi:hypothetical protein